MLVLSGCGKPQGRGEIRSAELPVATIADKEARQSIRECSQVAGDSANPDLVSFLGWEWSQVATDPGKHYGHKNVIFLDIEEGKVPTRAIASPRKLLATSPISRASQLMMSLMDFENRKFYWGIQQYYDEVSDTPICDAHVDTRQLPADCLEIARDPRELFAKLDQRDYDSIVIPHGNSWGMNTPATSTFDKQLNRAQHEPGRQILFEVYSGHGNSEECRRCRQLRTPHHSRAKGHRLAQLRHLSGLFQRAHGSSPRHKRPSSDSREPLPASISLADAKDVGLVNLRNMEARIHAG